MPVALDDAVPVWLPVPVELDEPVPVALDDAVPVWLPVPVELGEPVPVELLEPEPVELLEPELVELLEPVPVVLLEPLPVAHGVPDRCTAMLGVGPLDGLRSDATLRPRYVIRATTSAGASLRPAASQSADSYIPLA